MSAFSGGRLKLKGGLTVKGGKIKKVRKHKRTSTSKKDTLDLMEMPEGSMLPPSEADQDKRTASEKKFEEKVFKREIQRAKTQVLKSHREKVKEFNEYLAGLTEHHDIPKVGPG